MKKNFCGTIIRKLYNKNKERKFMRLWNGLTPHSIVLYKGRMYKIKDLYLKETKKVADLIDSQENIINEIDIMELKKVDD